MLQTIVYLFCFLVQKKLLKSLSHYQIISLNMRFTKYWNQLKWLREILQTLGDWDWMIVKYREKRSYEQLKLYFLLLTLVSRETWNDKDSLHDHMKMAFLSKYSTISLWGKRSRKKIPWSTKNIKKDEMSHFYKQVEQFFWNLGFHLPPSNTPEWQALVASCPEFYS